MRIAIGGIWHETNTFVPGVTRLEDFANYQLYRGAELLGEYEGTGSEIGGVIAASHELDVELAPLVFAAAVPSGIVEKETFEHLLEAMVSDLQAAGSLDGIVLALHGAMVSEGYDSPELHLVRAIRRELPDIPIAATLDLHANLDPAFCEVTQILCAYDTYPHVDMADRGEEALRLLARLVREGPPQSGHVKMPLLTVPQTQETSVAPMREVMAAVHEVERRPGVWSASALPGFPYSDVDRLGFSIYVAAEQDAQGIAEELAAGVWEERQRFVPELISPAEAVEAASREHGPVVLVDVADNVGGGSPGNGLALLEALVARGGRDAATVLWDPHAAAQAHEDAADRQLITVDGYDESGPATVRLEGRVEPLGVVRYRRQGPYMRGQLVDMGRVAVVDCAAGRVVVTERRVLPFDDTHLRVVGIEPERKQILVVKGATAWRAGLAAIAKNAYYVSTPGYCPADLARLEYRSGAPRAYPLAPDVQWVKPSATPQAPRA